MEEKRDARCILRVFFSCDVFTAEFAFVDGKKKPKAPTCLMLERLQ